ncbi:hypothetical protein ACGFIK_23500 [Micromonospora sp. NPDC048871]|uniref:hypothetical protein n=1 Tax=unclassified Micromonospora TaxID=2617518 RepID=UPI002E0F8A25|nr:hypothetical protein OIE53_26930 [Micromonospora sp. NBC_01739]
MAENYTDPSGNTQAFRAFAANTAETPAESPSRTGLFVGGALLAVLLIAVAGWIALG